MGIVRIAGYRTGRSKKGELYFAVDLKDDQNGYSWGIYKPFTKNGQPHEGSIKSAKITLRQLGLEAASPQHLEPLLKGIVGRYYSVEQAASDRLNTVTGQPYVNTNITGVASPPAQPVQQAPVAYQPPAQVQAPTQVQTPQGVASFPSAVPGQTLDQALTGQPPAAVMQQQVQAAAAQQDNSIPWENGPQGVAPSVVQQG
jgi:hypothetical protein